MTTKLITAATAVIIFSVLIAGNAWAEEFDPCAGLTGKAKGLCTAYTKGMGCNSDSTNAPDAACANVAAMLEETTGSPPPSDCPCDFSLDRVRSETEGFSDLSASFSCTSTTTSVDLQTSGRFDQMQAQNRGPGLSFRCAYIANGVPLEGKEEFPLPTAEIEQKLEACRGAVLTVAATLSLTSDSTCSL